ncbi:MAG: AAA family ATPase [Pirellulales bacterium]|nr:AAA family ATPase [Pirellulales bacterium]
MYQSHWGLRNTPFRNRLDPEFFFESPTHEEGLARLHFLVEQQRRLGLLMGGTGTGKSLLLEVFAAQMRQQGFPVANFSLLGMDPAELLRETAVQFGLNPGSRGLPELWRMVLDRIREHRYQQLATVVLLDDADRASPLVLIQIVRLAQHDLTPDSRLTLVLAGRQERMSRLGETLLELSELRIDLQDWQPDDTETYIAHTLARAGCRQPVFEEPAILRLHELAHGIPRRINQLADLALAAGAGQDLERIDADTVESVYHELGVIEV